MRTLFVMLLALSLSGCVAVGRSCAAGEYSGTYGSGGKTIPFERFLPDKVGRHPAVILVQSADGLQWPLLTAAYRQYAQQLAQAGYAVFFVHYFDSTGTKGADLPDMIKNFAVWQKTVSDMVSYAARQPQVSPKHIGLLGFSLGSFVSLSLASQDSQAAAVVEFFGGMPPGAIDHMKRMPPTLILHGTADPLVPVQEAYKLEDLLKKKNIPYEIKIYQGQGHGFLGADGEDAARRTVAFFDKYLKRD